MDSPYLVSPQLDGWLNTLQEYASTRFAHLSLDWINRFRRSSFGPGSCSCRRQNNVPQMLGLWIKLVLKEHIVFKIHYSGTCLRDWIRIILF